MEKYLKAEEVAKILGYNVQSVYRLMRQGKIPTVRIGNTRNVRIPNSFLKSSGND